MSQTKIGFYGHVKQYLSLKAEIDQAILEVLESGSYVLGPHLVKFEEELAHYMGRREAVGVNSGTDALLLAFASAEYLPPMPVPPPPPLHSNPIQQYGRRLPRNGVLECTSIIQICRPRIGNQQSPSI